MNIPVLGVWVWDIHSGLIGEEFEMWLRVAFVVIEWLVIAQLSALRVDQVWLIYVWLANLGVVY